MLSNPRVGRRSAEDVADAARRAGDHEALTIALRAAGWAAREAFDHDAALAYLDEADEVATRTGLSERRCEILIVRSAAYLELGRAGLARRDLHLAREIASPHTLPEVTVAEALLEDKVGNFHAAAAANRSALSQMAPDRPELRVKALNNLALLVARFGQHREAERLLAEALALAETFSEAFAGFVTESQAIVAITSGRPVLAMRRYELAERRLTRVQAQLVDLYLGKANALFTLRLLDEAAAAAAQAVAQVDGVAGGSLMLGEALLPQARIAAARNQHEEARLVAARAEQLFRRQGRTGWRAAASLLRLSAEVQLGRATTATTRELGRVERKMEAIGNRLGMVEAALMHGEVAADLGDRRAAVEAFERAGRTARRGTALLRLHGHRARARRAEILGETRRVGQICRRGLDELASYQATFASVELRTRAAAHGRALADIGLREALRSGRGEQVWSWLERRHATAFVRGSAHPDEHLQQLLTELRTDERKLRELAPDASSERAEVLRRITALERRVRTVSWTRDGGRDDLTAPSIRSLRALRRGLGRRVLLQIGEIDGRLVGVAVTANGFCLRRLGKASRVTTAGQHLAFALRRLAAPRSHRAARAALSSARETLVEMHRTLVDPFDAVLTAAEEVVVVVQGQLMAIPWAVLGPLAHRPVRVTPSASAWLRSSRAQPSSDRIVLVAGPDLRWADREVGALAGLYPRAEVLTAPRATCARVARVANGSRLVHIASHGRLRADSPMFSSVQLSDGPLTVHDLEDMEELAHHWILAACDLGRPGRLIGPELEGLTAVALARGAGAVIAAVVSVPDLSTQQMMIELHRHLADGRSSAEALQLSRSAVDRDDPSGFACAVAFSCYGGG